MFVFESCQLIEQLEQEVLISEKENQFSSNSINQIFRAMHTIKSSAAMMLFKNLSSLAHATEDLFFFIREEKPAVVNQAKLTDIVLECIDYMKKEMEEIQQGKNSDSDASELIGVVKAFLAELKGDAQAVEKTEAPAPAKAKAYYIPADTSSATATAGRNYYKATIFFEDGCEMENVRAFTIVHNMKEWAADISYIPDDIIANEGTAEIIKSEGFVLFFSAEGEEEEVRDAFSDTAFLRHLELSVISEGTLPAKGKKQIILDEPIVVPEKTERETPPTQVQQSIISVNVNKLDKLMDIVGELVIAEAMVTQHPDLSGLKLHGFLKAARQLRKISGELQDVVMSIRMVPLAPTFNKMNRIVRDACKSLQKEVELEIIGEDTEVDKNIIENISDPLMHLIRNSIDHGIEPAIERREEGKAEKGRITLEAKNAGGDVWIIVKDDGRGLNREKILKKARENGLTSKADNELSDQEIYSFIFLPGFSTKDKVTEMSGRGVGMDVVTKNIEKVGGTVMVDSKAKQGTTISIKIPLTLAIIDGMTIRVGGNRYTLPTISIRQSFRPKEKDIICDQDGNEMMIIRGQCFPVLRLHEIFGIETQITDICQGIIMLIENNGRGFCIFADELVGQQQVVVKPLPSYIKKVQGLAGCTLLGGGSISLILDVDGFAQSYM